MNQHQAMIADMAGALFAELGTSANVESDWDAVEQVALPALLLSNEQGGFGSGWDDALIVFRLAGYHALALPIVEATIAAGLSGVSVRERGTIASASSGAIVDDLFTGVVSGAPWGDGAAYVVAPRPGGGSMFLATASAQIEEGANIAGEPRIVFRFESTAVKPLDADVFALGALARAAQIAGALDATLALSVTYASDRQQFGRPLAKFQAVQQSLATLACEAAAANVSALGAAHAQASGRAHFEIAAAKLRGNQAVGAGTTIAHQVHGAIGFTEEYPLQRLTRRLWAWRSEFGGDSHWSRILGGIVCARGAENFWADMTALTDQGESRL